MPGAISPELLAERDAFRFWSNVHPKDSGCWEWQGERLAKGHGRFTMRHTNQVRVVASRYVYELVIGHVPKGLCALHKCDNPPCVNPAHIFLGTKRDNFDDAVAKGRITLHNKPFCNHGHAMVGRNVRIKVAKGYATRCCRLCARDAARIYRAEKLKSSPQEST